MRHPAHEQQFTLRTDTTLRWACRRGDFLLWLTSSGPLARASNVDCADFWETRDGDFVTITNRIQDLPAQFELHPSEVQNSLAWAMMDKLNSGWKPPVVPMDGPNLWRLRAGDRLVWIGDSRPGQPAIAGVLAIIDCHDCALAERLERACVRALHYGTPDYPTLKRILATGLELAPLQAVQPPPLPRNLTFLRQASEFAAGLLAAAGGRR